MAVELASLASAGSGGGGARSDGGARFARLSPVGRRMALALASLASARPEMVDLGSKNVENVGKNVARII